MGHQDDGAEILLRLGARSEKKEDLRKFGKMIPSLILCGPPGVAVIGGVPKATEVVSYWPALLKKSLVSPKVAIFDGSLKEDIEIKQIPTGNFVAENEIIEFVESPSEDLSKLLTESSDPELTPISKIALGRSGDKGDMANIGVIARSPKAYEFLKQNLTPQLVKNWFQELCLGKVTRFELDKLRGLNFLLDKSLGGGGTQTLRTDAQGKTFSHALLRQRIKIPQEVIEEVEQLDGKWV